MRLMKFVEESSNLRVRRRATRWLSASRSPRATSSPRGHHQRHALRRAVPGGAGRHPRAPEAERDATAEGAKTLLEPYFRIMAGDEQVNVELARPWKATISLLLHLERLARNFRS
jgi:hypothetical protein